MSTIIQVHTGAVLKFCPTEKILSTVSQASGCQVLTTLTVASLTLGHFRTLCLWMSSTFSSNILSFHGGSAPFEEHYFGKNVVASPPPTEWRQYIDNNLKGNVIGFSEAAIYS